MSEPAVYRVRSTGVSWREVSGQTVGLDLGNSEYFGLNATGTVLWRRLIAGATMAELTEALMTEALMTGENISCDQAAVDVEAFLTDLSGRGLLNPHLGC